MSSVLNRLLIDVGASSIKSVIQKKNKPELNTLYTSESFSTKYGNKFNSDLIIKEFIAHAEKQYETSSYKEIWICSEMHNFTLFNKKTKEYSDFHSWRHVSEDSYKMKSKVMNFNNDHHKVTGQTLFEGIPYTNLSNLYKKDDPYNLLTLPELIVHKYGNYNNRLHNTMAASTGFLDLEKKKWLMKDINQLYPNLELIMPEIFNDDEIPLLGSIKIKNNNVNVFGGFGDLQTALMGSSIKEDDICINIGTGSQVIALSEEDAPYSANFDIKPFLEDTSKQ